MGGPAVGQRIHRSGRPMSSGPAGEWREISARADANLLRFRSGPALFHPPGRLRAMFASSSSNLSSMIEPKVVVGPGDVGFGIRAAARSLLLSTAGCVFHFSVASCSMKKGFPASSLGRSKGVMVAFVHTPCKSGWPSGVRGAVQVLAAGDGVSNTTAPANARAAVEANRWLIQNLLSPVHLVTCLRKGPYMSSSTNLDAA